MDSNLNTEQKRFEEFYNKIPDVELSGSMHQIAFTQKSYEYCSEISFNEFARESGIPEGKIIRMDFVIIFYTPQTSGTTIIIQTFNKNGKRISSQILFSIDGIADLDEPDIRFEDANFKMDNNLNIYCAYQDRFIKAGTQDTITLDFKETYYRIDDFGNVIEVIKK